MCGVGQKLRETISILPVPTESQPSGDAGVGNDVEKPPRQEAVGTTNRGIERKPLSLHPTEHQIVEFSKLGYGIVAWDWLGCGKSDKPDSWAAYSCAELFEDVKAVYKRSVMSSWAFGQQSYNI